MTVSVIDSSLDLPLCRWIYMEDMEAEEIYERKAGLKGGAHKNTKG